MARCAKMLIPLVVSSNPLLMNRTINFDHESATRTVKIDDEATERMLSSELDVIDLFRFQRLPQHCFAACLREAKGPYAPGSESQLVVCHVREKPLPPAPPLHKWRGGRK